MKKFLLVVDVQNGFVVDGINDDAVKNLDCLLKNNVFDCVISSIYQNYENSPIFKLMGWNKMFTEEEQAVVGETLQSSNYFIKKNKYSSYSEELLDILKKENFGQIPETVFVVGLDTECCVLMTAVDLFEAGIRPIVLAKYCGASSGMEAHEAGICSLQSLIGRNNIFYEAVNTKEDIDYMINHAKTVGYISSSSAYKKAKQLIDLLIKKKWHISFAESCTGGLAAAGIVDIANASNVFNASFVTYANDAKVKYVDVKEETIDKHGVVSEEVAIEMARGVALANNAEVGVGISGIAGPTGATPKKPVGMVCFGFYIDGKEYTLTKQFGSIGRTAVRKASVLFVYESLISFISNIK